MPKGVLWRQADVVVAAMASATRRAGAEWESLGEEAGGAARPPAPHPAARAVHGTVRPMGCDAGSADGNTLVIQDEVRRFRPGRRAGHIERQQVVHVTIVGDAFARRCR